MIKINIFHIVLMEKRMKKVIFVVIKKIVLAICLVYAFNLLASGLRKFS